MLFRSTKTQNSSTKRLVTGEEKIKSWGFLMKQVDGELKKMRLLKRQKITSKICLLRHTQIMQIWRMSLNQLIDGLQLI